MTDNGHVYDPKTDRCMYCECRPWGDWAQEPCGATELSKPPMNEEQWDAKLRLYSELKEKGIV
jgi:hypothetical protein